MSFYNFEPFYKDFFRELDISLELILKKADIQVARFTEQGLKVSKEEYIRLMKVIDSILPDENMLTASQLDMMTRFTPPLFAALCSKDGVNCFHRISKYKKLIGPFVLKIVQDQEFLHLEFIFDDYLSDMPRFAVMTEQVLMVGIIRQGTGLKIMPAGVSSQYDYNTSLVEYFGCQPTHSKNNRLSFKLDDLKEPFLTENNIMWQYIEPELTKRLKESQQEGSFKSQIRKQLLELIPAGHSTINDVSKQLAMSPRSIQRRLFQEKTSFNKELSYMKEMMARNYLKDQHVTTDEIAFLTGYSDANAFNRAFKSWTGMTTREYRLSLAN
jgi:AraC-like DNA-binding protein